MDTMDTSTEVSQLSQTVSQAIPKKDEVAPAPPCERCERRKLRERGYAREARKRKKLAGDCKNCEEGEIIS